MRLTSIVLLLIVGAQAQSPPGWRFTEELRIGSETDDVTGFSDIRGLLVDAKGSIVDADDHFHVVGIRRDIRWKDEP